MTILRLEEVATHAKLWKAKHHSDGVADGVYMMKIRKTLVVVHFKKNRIFGFEKSKWVKFRKIQDGQCFAVPHDRRPAMMVDSADTMYVMADGEKCVDTIDLTVGDVVPVMQTTFTKFEQLWSGPKIADTPAPHK